MTHPELRYVRPPTPNTKQCTNTRPSVGQISVRLRSRTWLRTVVVRFPVRAADRVPRQCQRTACRPSAVRWCVRAYFPAALVSPVAVAAGSTVVSDLAPVRTRDGHATAHPRGVTDVTGPTAGRVAHPVQDGCYFRGMTFSGSAWVILVANRKAGSVSRPLWRRSPSRSPPAAGAGAEVLVIDSDAQGNCTEDDLGTQAS